MQNTLYLSQLAEARTQDLSRPEYSGVYSTLQRLQADPLSDTQILYEDANLRVAHSPNHRIIFRYVPADHAVLVTDIEPTAHAAAA